MAVAVPMRQVFDFLPADPETTIQSGARFWVPFGAKRQVAVLLDSVDSSELPREKLKKVHECLDEEPAIPPDVMALLRWASDYYHHPIGEVVFSALPVLLRSRKRLTEPEATFWKLTQLGQSVDSGQLKRAPRQLKLVNMLAGHPDGMSESAILELEPGSQAILKKLAEKKLLSSFQVSLQADSAVHQTPGSTHPFNLTELQLNPQQQDAVNNIAKSIDTFSVHLLEGVTGSGKTEVYLAMIEKMIALGKQSLVLVPEINLTPQLTARFQARCRKPVAVLHSQLTDNQRLNTWLAAGKGEVDVVIGTRSAITTPMPALGLIVVDEEHDASYKQQDGFRYSARDMAVKRGSLLDIPVILGSATPSLETLNNVFQKKYQASRLTSRYGAAIHPTTQIVDIRSQRLVHGLSDLLLQQIRDHVGRGNQVLLFINRRGFAQTYMCHHCGWIANCQRCDSHMTFHQFSRRLRCHHCGAERAAEEQCPQCLQAELITLGEGTERIETAIKEMVPGAVAVRVDRDSTRRKGAMETILDDINNGTVNVLIGTQMLAKGHHFPNVTLVGIINVDQGLYSIDFRAMEKTAQLVIQVAGRAGRAEKPGHVVIQTHFPEHPLLQTLVSRGYDEFARQTLQEREAAMLPPFTHTALMRAEAVTQSLPMEFLTLARDLSRECMARADLENKVQLLGPLPSPMERRAGRYRAQLFIQSDQRAALHGFLTAWLPQLEQNKSGRKVRWSIDVDPADIY